MPRIQETETFSDWISKLRDLEARSRINIRLRRLALGNPGKVKPVGEGVSELKIDYGPAYRVYFVERADKTIVVLLCGGDKRTQNDDIRLAKRMAKEI
ncbi:type II toxin-antitoxin system RelE/ParE family toxin [Methylobacterium sp. 174MFSha1.1]|uniref:type II toxin-antitoxin system RelE/ParE family toxin n=1 Tax=Methylobacterium sp. 174MFSha1.1 TaxID=1502749 RepID=UPI000B892971|nr:type II toxin-antitoxin system RelE/ParE family toxin [Methylobacterium sp. 174MFSha1.1]